MNCQYMCPKTQKECTNKAKLLGLCTRHYKIQNTQKEDNFHKIYIAERFGTLQEYQEQIEIENKLKKELQWQNHNQQK